jgi:GNAT superfamily N-acetyltransferase
MQALKIKSENDGEKEMEIQLTETTNPNNFELAELRIRAENSSKSRNTIHYRATIHGREVGFLSLDHWYDLRCMVLYELFIAVEQRRKGIGRALITIIEKRSKAEGLRWLRLRPEPLDQGISQQELVDWYLSIGYEWCQESNHDMQKEL